MYLVHLFHQCVIVSFLCVYHNIFFFFFFNSTKKKLFSFLSRSLEIRGLLCVPYTYINWSKKKRITSFVYKYSSRHSFVITWQKKKKKKGMIAFLSHDQSTIESIIIRVLYKGVTTRIVYGQHWLSRDDLWFIFSITNVYTRHVWSIPIYVRYTYILSKGMEGGEEN